MTIQGVFYRVSQVWNALTARPDKDSLKAVECLLSSELMELFSRMQPSEQVHCLQVYGKLKASGETNQDLLTAALLHDVGKIRSPIRIWERVEVVLLKKFFPEKVKEWGNGSISTWRKPFVVAQNHPEWGAELASRAGASVLTVALIRRHQETEQEKKLNYFSEEDCLLAKLQVFDNES